MASNCQPSKEEEEEEEDEVEEEEEVNEAKRNLPESFSIIATTTTTTATLPTNQVNSDNFKHEPTHNTTSNVAYAVKQETTTRNNLHIKSKNIKTINKLSQKGSDITRCICEMDHDDGFMICCDKCL